jgi:hypothetical protein
MKNKQITLSTKDAIALVEKSAESVMIRKAIKTESGRTLPARYASVSDGVVLGMSGRILSESKFVEAYASKIGDSKAKEVYAVIQSRMNKVGEEALARTLDSVKGGRRKVTRVFANLQNGRSVIETITTNKAIDVEEVAVATKVDGKAVDPKVAAAIARNLIANKLA